MDTHVLSKLRKGPRAARGVRNWFDASAEGDVYTSVLVLGEIRRGIEAVRRRDPSGAAALEQWLARMTESFADRVLGIDASIADRWGALNMPDPIPTLDGLLAATALVHGMTVVTRNVRDIGRTGVAVLDPFSE